MFSVGGSGSYSKSSGRSKSSYLMDSQKYGLRGMWSHFLAPYFSSASGPGGGKLGERAGLGVPKYEGQLAGTYRSPMLSNLFAQATRRSTGGGGYAQPSQVQGSVDPQTGERVTWQGQYPDQSTMFSGGPATVPSQPRKTPAVQPAQASGDQEGSQQASLVGKMLPGMGAQGDAEAARDKSSAAANKAMLGSASPERRMAQPVQQPGDPGYAPQSDLFSHYDYFDNPELRTEEAVEHYDELVAQDREKEDALLRSRMKSMGLQHSTDMLKHQSDINRRREAEKMVFADSIRQRYEDMGFMAGESEMASIERLGGMQSEIENQGLAAEFNEWLRTQPENNPMLQVMLQYLGLQGKADTTTHGSNWAVSGSGGGGMM